MSGNCWCAIVYAALADRGVAFCNVSVPDFPETYVETAPFA